ncbi:hypothetical protein ACIHEI_27740 [Kitasatospora sp. NPDC051984]|uniref:hypothetical protein n=1 Tax=Kitasatospora sp. NPDC051984 TaxID=3364059 RepID=UPI0037CC6FCD
MPSNPAPTDARTAELPVPQPPLLRRLVATVHVDPAGRVLLYRRTAEAPHYPGHYDLLMQRRPPEGQLLAGGGFLVVRRVLTDRPPVPGPDDAEIDWCGFVPPAELLAGHRLPLVPDGVPVLRRLITV